MSNQNVDLVIFDKTYKIESPIEEQESLLAAAKYLDGKMKEIRQAARGLESERVAVLAALNICHELFQSKQQADMAQKIGQALQILTGKIDKTLAQNS
ncbi:MAG TPA: cell division protein ZapA [Agitococcus sp.]|mgnify:FL=1|uniref:cell division protein ZapA n=1 Tax=uncultured Agitococcus sp. TaxID=1506599 RepID=UPI00262BC16E|nr:cell division protein ZapA [uncultured Agitococcus sp.]HMU87925.1 cell division protein ZapA [Agitococcus sp.]HMV60819.1 cell division protein ZapA [Agitococcus sp.]